MLVASPRRHITMRLVRTYLREAVKHIEPIDRDAYLAEKDAERAKESEPARARRPPEPQTNGEHA